MFFREKEKEKEKEEEKKEKEEEKETFVLSVEDEKKTVPLQEKHV
jgi:hypothetical protein